MNLVSLAGHTVDLDLLPECPMVLDVGCRGWDFKKAMCAYRPLSVWASLDPDPSVTDENGCCTHVALVGDLRTEARYVSGSTGEGNFLAPYGLTQYYDNTFSTVRCTNIGALMDNLRVPHWDVVKLDCEGSEFQILALWPGPIATQISVEFHDTGHIPGYPKEYDFAVYYERMFARLVGFGYNVVQHELSAQNGWQGHWDSLITL